MEERHITIIGGGINGLVAANYLRRSGCAVTILERKEKVGGAVSTGSFAHKGKKITYSNGASVLGFMQDFVFKETGLKKRIVTHLPKHPEIVYFGPNLESCLLYDDIPKLKLELRKKWNERGKVSAFFKDQEKVVRYLRRGYKRAEVPTIAAANKHLGAKLVRLWIQGSAKNLLDHYFTSDQTKVYFSIPVTESGPVDLNTPYSAFSIPLMASGSIFDGHWGYVKGGIWQITTALERINQELGIKTITGAEVIKVSPQDMSVTYQKNNKVKKSAQSDYILFATDPLSAARVLGDKVLTATVSHKQLVGSSGKLIMAFKRPVVWAGDRGVKDFSSALRYFVSLPDLQAMDDSSELIKTNKTDFSNAYLEIYCEGAGDRSMGNVHGYELVSVFFKNLSLARRGISLGKVRQYVEQLVLSKINNKNDLIKSILLTPRDLRESFYFPGGNIDHVELSSGQTFFNRTYSADPETNFYQFGNHERVLYCAAGTYPCGSVAGTPGYMCAQQLIQRMRKKKQIRSL